MNCSKIPVETTIVYRGYIGIMEKGNYYSILRLHKDKKTEATIVSWGIKDRLKRWILNYQ